MDKRTEELSFIRELLEATLQEEGYEIPQQSYADKGYLAFDVPLRNPRVKGEKATVYIQIEAHGE